MRGTLLPRSSRRIPRTYSALALAEKPLLYWKLNEVSGNPADSSGNGRGGTAVGGMTYGQPSLVPTDPGSAILLNGTTGYFTSSYNPFTGQRTFEGIARRATTSTVDSMFGGDNATPGPDLEFSSGTGQVNWYPAVNNSAYSWFFTGASAGAWFHWALTYDNAAKSAELYFNGVSQGVKTTAAGYDASPGNLQVGARGGAQDMWNGTMQHFVVYSGLLTATQIQRHYYTAVRRIS